nr:hotdog fold thioesterase [Halioglobus sp.]
MDAQQLAEASAAAMWAGDRAGQALAMKIEAVAPGTASLSMAVREDMVNGHGICHGGFIFTLADTAFAYACNSQNHRAVAAGARI